MDDSLLGGGHRNHLVLRITNGVLVEQQRFVGQLFAVRVVVSVVVRVINPNNVQGERRGALRVRIVGALLALYVLVLVDDGVDVVDERLPEHGHVLVLVV